LLLACVMVFCMLEAKLVLKEKKKSLLKLLAKLRVTIKLC
jgi:hypothetical protein